MRAACSRRPHVAIGRSGCYCHGPRALPAPLHVAHGRGGDGGGGASLTDGARSRAIGVMLAACAGVDGADQVRALGWALRAWASAAVEPGPRASGCCRRRERRDGALCGWPTRRISSASRWAWGGPHDARRNVAVKLFHAMLKSEVDGLRDELSVELRRTPSCNGRSPRSNSRQPAAARAASPSLVEASSWSGARSSESCARRSARRASSSRSARTWRPSSRRRTRSSISCRSAARAARGAGAPARGGAGGADRDAAARGDVAQELRRHCERPPLRALADG